MLTNYIQVKNQITAEEIFASFIPVSEDSEVFTLTLSVAAPDMIHLAMQ